MPIKVGSSLKLRSGGMARAASGFTLLEFLIAGTLGLLLMGGVGVIFVNSNSTFRAQRESAMVQDNGRFALWFLQDEIQRAGFTLDFTSATKDPFGFQTPVVLDGGGDASDRLVIRYVGATDCAGAAAPGNQVQNEYFVDVAAQRLMCLGNGGGAAQPMAEGVENMQVLYGLSATSSLDDRVPQRFANATEAAPLVQEPVAVRVGLVMVAAADTMPDVALRSYRVQDQTLEFTDRRQRRVLEMTVMAPNTRSQIKPL